MEFILRCCVTDLEIDCVVFEFGCVADFEFGCDADCGIGCIADFETSILAIFVSR